MDLKRTAKIVTYMSLHICYIYKIYYMKDTDKKKKNMKDTK